MNSQLILASFVALVFSVLGVFITRYLTLRFNILDFPNTRSSHEKPMPRGGGLGILLGIGAAYLAGVIMGTDLPPWGLWIGLGLVFMVGLWDDLVGGLHVSIRFVAQILATLIVVIFIGKLSFFPLPTPFDFKLPGVGYIFSSIWIVVIINFYNFMDGIDGIAGIQAVIVGSTLAIVACGNIAWLGSVLAGASIGFLLFNWQPAKIFLGDVGSYSLGYLIAATPFIQGDTASYKLTMLVGLSLWLFLADASFTIIKRILSRKRIWEAHRSHLYQRLTKTGLSHARVASLIGAGAIVISALAGLAYTQDEGYLWWLSFILASLIFILEIYYTRMREKRYNLDKG
jgi:Fuc2NAc and GlcNAc transferase